MGDAEIRSSAPPARDSSPLAEPASSPAIRAALEAAAALDPAPVAAAAPLKTQSNRVAVFGVFAVAVLVVLLACYAALGWRQEPLRIFTFPLETRMPATPCIKVSREQIRNGSVSYSGGDISLSDVRNSLLYQMEKEEYSAACASFLHLPVHMCFCIINLAPERGSRSFYEEMYNLEYVSLSALALVLTTEHFPFCEKPVKRTRAKTCVARYLDKNGVLQMYRAVRDDALYIQSMADVCDANAVCQDTNDQVMMARIIGAEHADNTPRLGDGRGRS
jgi:hypothetical protein